jgi:hypothetical protein
MLAVDASVMLHLREGFIEVMQECTPALILG